MGSRLANSPKIGNVHCLFYHALIRCIKDRSQWDVLQQLVYAQFVRIEDHDG
jgi:hypothetical protein